MGKNRNGAFWQEVQHLRNKYQKIHGAASSRQIASGDDMFAFRASVKRELQTFRKDSGSPKWLKIIFNLVQFASRVFVLLWPELLEQKGRK